MGADSAAMRVRVADGDHAGHNVHLPGEEAWLFCDRRHGAGRTKYHLTNHPRDTALKVIAADIKARWPGELARQQLEQEVGKRHFEGRSSDGLHHHAALSMIALAFLQQMRARESLCASGRRSGSG